MLIWPAADRQMWPSLCQALQPIAGRCLLSSRTAPDPRSLAPRPHFYLHRAALSHRCVRRANTDPVAYYKAQDAWIKEYWVHIEYMKLLKDEVPHRSPSPQRPAILRDPAPSYSRQRPHLPRQQRLQSRASRSPMMMAFSYSSLNLRHICAPSHGVLPRNRPITPAPPLPQRHHAHSPFQTKNYGICCRNSCRYCLRRENCERFTSALFSIR
jgi:hypothetical protein